MINHVRTHLLNVSGPHEPVSAVPLDEYIPAYHAVALENTPMQRLEQILYGTQPDYAGRCWRTAQYMRVLHATAPAEMIRVDARITYDVDTWRNAPTGVTIVGPPLPLLQVSGRWAPDAATGRTITQWVVQVSPVAVAVTGTHTRTHEIFDYSPALSYPLAGSTLRVSIAQPANEARYVILHRAPPQPDLATILSNLHAAHNDVGWLLQQVRASDPTYYDMFFNHVDAPKQLSGALLAYARQVEVMRGR